MYQGACESLIDHFAGMAVWATGMRPAKTDRATRDPAWGKAVFLGVPPGRHDIVGRVPPLPARQFIFGYFEFDTTLSSSI